MARLIQQFILLATAFVQGHSYGVSVIAHRGAWGLVPEHTREALVAAKAFGADHIEVDVILSKDGIPVVLHDPILNDNSNVTEIYTKTRARGDGLYYVIDFTLAELHRLNIQERRLRGKQQQRFPGRFSRHDIPFKIMTLAEYMNLLEELNRVSQRRTGLVVELKGEAFHRQNGQHLSKTVAPLLASTHLPIILESFEPETLQWFKQHGSIPAVPMVQLLEARNIARLPHIDYGKLKTSEGLKKIRQYADGIGIAVSDTLNLTKSKLPQVTPLVLEAKKLGMKVFTFTIRKDQLPSGTSFAKLVWSLRDVARVDALFTDFVGETRHELGRKIEPQRSQAKL